MPTMQRQFHLTDKEGSILRISEKNVQEYLEMFTIFGYESDWICDICCGTGASGLAAMMLNRQGYIGHDRDKTTLIYARNRLRAFASRRQFTADPGNQVELDWWMLSTNPYLWQCVLPEFKMKKIDSNVAMFKHNIPAGVDRDGFCKAMNVYVANSKVCEGEHRLALFAKTEIKEGTTITVFGSWRRRVMSDNGMVTSVRVRDPIGAGESDRDPWYLHISKKCPAYYVNDPSLGPDDNEFGTNAQIVVDPAKTAYDYDKVLLQVTEDIPANEEIWIFYNCPSAYYSSGLLAGAHMVPGELKEPRMRMTLDLDGTVLFQVECFFFVVVVVVAVVVVEIGRAHV